MEKFNTPVDMEIDYDSIKPQGLNYESRSTNINIEYHFILELRSWGIKSFSFILPTQEISFDLEMVDEATGDYEDYSFKLKIEGEIETPENFSAGDICPQSLSLEITELQKTGDTSFEGKGKAVLSFESA